MVGGHVGEAGADGDDPVDDAEILYRRILPAHFPQPSPHPSPKAFRPTKADTTGLSLFRAKHMSSEEVAAEGRGKSYYVAAVRAGDIRRSGMTLECTGGKAHVEIPELTYVDRKKPFAEEHQVGLATKLCLRTDGPFPGQAALADPQGG